MITHELHTHTHTIQPLTTTHTYRTFPITNKKSFDTC